MVDGEVASLDFVEDGFSVVVLGANRTCDLVSVDPLEKRKLKSPRIQGVGIQV